MLRALFRAFTLSARRILFYEKLETFCIGSFDRAAGEPCLSGRFCAVSGCLSGCPDPCRGRAHPAAPQQRHPLQPVGSGLSGPRLLLPECLTPQAFFCKPTPAGTGFAPARCRSPIYVFARPAPFCRMPTGRRALCFLCKVQISIPKFLSIPAKKPAICMQMRQRFGFLFCFFISFARILLCCKNFGFGNFSFKRNNNTWFFAGSSTIIEAETAHALRVWLSTFRDHRKRRIFP